MTAPSGETFDGWKDGGGTAYTAGASYTVNANVTFTAQWKTSGGGDITVDALVLTTLVTAPVNNHAQNTTAIDETQYTGSIAWKEADGITNAPANFAPSTVYKAIVTLTPKTGYTFSGVAANTYTYSGATVTNAANSGTVIITFPATAGLMISIGANATHSDITAAVTTALGNGIITGNGTTGDPYVVSVSIDLSGLAFAKLYAAIDAALSAGKVVSLDLSASTGTSIGYVALSGSYSSQQAVRDRFVAITLPTTVTTITTDSSIYSDYAFTRFTKLKSITANGVISVGFNAFSYCTSLEAVSLPAATTFSGGTFMGCTSLETMSLPAATTFDDNTFAGCTSLETVSLPAATTFGSYTFAGCTSLETVSLPVATAFGPYTFSDCTSLATINLGSTPPTIPPVIGYSTFSQYPGGSNSVVIHIPSTAGAAYASAIKWSTLPLARNADASTWGDNHPALSLVADL